MPGRDMFALYDRLLKGTLIEVLSALKAEGLSANEIAYRIRSEHDVDVSHETVRRWLRREDVEAFIAKQGTAA